MAAGPVEFLIVGLPTTQFNGDVVAPEIMKLIHSSTIRILDFVVVSKEEDGSVSERRCDSFMKMLGLATSGCISGGVITPDDVAHVLTTLEADHSAVLVTWEDLWAIPLVEAIRDANGVVVEGARVPQGVIEMMQASRIGERHEAF